jgi:hypothetical protein
MQDIDHKTLAASGASLFNEATLRKFLLDRFEYYHGYKPTLSASVTFNAGSLASRECYDETWPLVFA